MLVERYQQIKPGCNECDDTHCHFMGMAVMDFGWSDEQEALRGSQCHQAKSLMPDRKREIFEAVLQDWQVTIRRACLALQFDRSTCHYLSR
ncbi:MAG: hypothetical protein KDE55_02670 [Novosphingobium sp.]|nr:hypothetical protein [Novosphingobium sp.]